MTNFRVLTGIDTGAAVVGSDGQKIGTVVAVRPNYIVVERGCLFPKDYFIPVEAIHTVAEQHVRLHMSCVTVLNGHLTQAPEDFDDGPIVHEYHELAMRERTGS